MVEGTSCTQSAFRTPRASFLFVGLQGGRHKAMFKLAASRAEAERLAAANPDDYQVGKTGWVTARFTAAKPMPQRLWERWLDESYALSAPEPRTGAAAGARTDRAARRTAMR